MENVINTLSIQNFKSIRNVLLHPRRVNLLIGEPNVGKSTVLEAISLLGSFPYEAKKKFMHSFIRYEKPAQLFHNNLVTNPVRIASDRDVCLMGRAGKGKGYKYGVLSQDTYQQVRAQLGLPQFNEVSRSNSGDDVLLDRLYAHLVSTDPETVADYLYTEFDRHGRVDQPGPGGRYLASVPSWQPQPVKPYRFKRNTRLDHRYPESALRPPYGNNLVQVLESHKALRHELVELFAQHGLRLSVRPDASRLEVMKEMDGISYVYPYASSGDTLQRYGFYMAAMESNRDTVVLMEEPEAHAYPASVTRLAERIARQQTNQFFITTHSPYLFNEVLDNMLPYESREPELAVFMMYQRDSQSRIRQLTDEEVRAIKRDSVDVFRNLGQMEQEPVRARRVAVN